MVLHYESCKRKHIIIIYARRRIKNKLLHFFPSEPKSVIRKYYLIKKKGKNTNFHLLIDLTLPKNGKGKKDAVLESYKSNNIIETHGAFSKSILHYEAKQDYISGGILFIVFLNYMTF